MRYVFFAKLMLIVCIGELLGAITKALNKDDLGNLFYLATFFSCLALVSKEIFRALAHIKELFQ